MSKESSPKFSVPAFSSLKKKNVHTVQKALQELALTPGSMVQNSDSDNYTPLSRITPISATFTPVKGRYAPKPKIPKVTGLDDH